MVLNDIITTADIDGQTALMVIFGFQDGLSERFNPASRLLHVYSVVTDLPLKVF